jgi:chemotaxis family two-component system response regulator Rcp1
MKQQDNSKLVDILLVEDNEGDARLAKEAMRDSKIRNTLHHVSDGEEAMTFLRKEGKYENVPRPDLILLDLNLPRKSGREVLREVKADDGLSAIPVVVLTTSAADEDIAFSYRTHANTYIIKPVNLDRFLEVIGSIGAYWSHIARLPGGNNGNSGNNNNPVPRPT